jgi:hypothetical protein
MTAAELRRALELLPAGASLTLTREALLEAVTTAAPEPAAQVPEGADRLLTPGEVAAQLGTTVRWVYDHADQLGGRRLSRRCLRFPVPAVRRYVERRR